MNSPTPETQDQACGRFLKDAKLGWRIIDDSMERLARLMFNCGVMWAQKTPIGYAYIPKGGTQPVVVDARFKDLPHVFPIYK